MSTLPKPIYRLWEAIDAAISIGLRCMQELRQLQRLPGPPGPQGEKGISGRDGISAKDFKFDGERTITFKSEDEEFKIVFPCMIYRGVWAPGKYDRGDVVTRDGSLWHADVNNIETRPGDKDSGWTLCAKRGRDGKDGERGPKGDKGDPGANGRDLTQMGPDGRKW